jgi:hypothetical protein
MRPWGYSAHTRARTKKQEETMRRLILLLTATSVIATAGVTICSGAQAEGLAPIGLRNAADDLILLDSVGYTWKGRQYCWYNAGWRGAGWYWCGYERRRGFGWGGPPGWRGWHRPGHRPGIHPPKPGRPGIHPPKPGRPGGLPGTPRPTGNPPGGSD